MTTYSRAQVEQLWTQAGGPATVAPLMAEIATLESGRSDTSLNTTPPDYSVGLWQVNYYGGLLGPRTAAYGSPAQLSGNPQAQARAAVDIYRSQGLQAWSTAAQAEANLANGVNTGDSPAASSLTGSGGGGVAGAPAAAAGSDCLISIPSVLGVGGGCLLSRQEGRVLVGGLLMTGGVVVGLVGLVLVAAFGLKLPAGAKAVAAAAPVVSGVRHVARRARPAAGGTP